MTKKHKKNKINREKPQKIHTSKHKFGAGGGTRTPTPFRKTDFKSAASTIPPRPQPAHNCFFMTNCKDGMGGFYKKTPTILKAALKLAQGDLAYQQHPLA